MHYVLSTYLPVDERAASHSHLHADVHDAQHVGVHDEHTESRTHDHTTRVHVPLLLAHTSPRRVHEVLYQLTKEQRL